jgi:hypothetical protein
MPARVSVPETILLGQPPIDSLGLPSVGRSARCQGLIVLLMAHAWRQRTGLTRAACALFPNRLACAWPLGRNALVAL